MPARAMRAAALGGLAAAAVVCGMPLPAGAAPAVAAPAVAAGGVPRNALLAWVDWNGTVWAARLAGGAPRRLADNVDLDPTGSVPRLLLSRDASRLVLVAGREVLYGTGTGARPLRRVLDRRVDAAALSPDGLTFFFAESSNLGRDGIVRALDLGTGALRVVADPPWPVTDLAPSSDGSRLAYASGTVLRGYGYGPGGTAHVVDLVTGRDSRVGPPDADVQTVAWGAGDELLITTARGDDDYYTDPLSGPPYPAYPNAGAAPDESDGVVAFVGGGADEEPHVTAASAVDGRPLFPGRYDSVVVDAGPEGAYALTADEQARRARVSFAPADGSRPVDLLVPTGVRDFAVAYGPIPAPLRLRGHVEDVELSNAYDRVGASPSPHPAGEPVLLEARAQVTQPGTLPPAVLYRWQSGRWARLASVPVTAGRARFRVAAAGYTTFRVVVGRVSDELTLPVAYQVRLSDSEEERARRVLRGTLHGASGGTVRLERQVSPEVERRGRRPLAARWEPVATAPVRAGRFVFRVPPAEPAYYRVVRDADARHEAGDSGGVQL
ncbi:WD40 repeat domain-containing protein [Motilibacter aurantiacus]|uniref:WD40 repeat domain-containing protein n=1 Tax=Motilibacter aurantiacus TaxID=2714955 RepID=UPI001407348E|nr:hypothetical protein [Motilibacter aurantiacus]NHC44001.1 hypothetical protein [Motilibacter aurantiacus]